MKYSVMFNGNTAEGRKIADVKRKLTAVLKVTPEEVEKMFTGEPVLIAGESDLEACEKLIKVGQRCGAIFYIVKQEASPEQVLEIAIPAKTSSVSSKSQGLVLIDEEEAFSVREPKFQHQNYIGSVADILSGFSIFEDLTIDEIKIIIAYLRLDRFPDGHYIFGSGDMKKKLFVILSGKAEMQNKEGKTLFILGKGEIFGETTLLSSLAEEYQLTAVEPVTVLYMSDLDFEKAAAQIPVFQKNFIRLLSQRLTKIQCLLQEKRNGYISGRLQDMPLNQLLAELHQQQTTGTLILKTDNSSAYFTFKQGVPVNARWLDKKGADAFIAAFVIKHGEYLMLADLTLEDEEAEPIGDFDQLMEKGMADTAQEKSDFLNTKLPGT